MRRPWALPFVPLWWVGTGLKNVLYDRRVLPVRTLVHPALSVGSLSAGGAGKTPVVLMLARLLDEMGCKVDVLSRGYGRGSGCVERVDPAGSAQRFGDEPLEMARAGLTVFVGAERFAAGQLAEAQAGDAGGPRVHLLDDGFQHRRLARSLDVVLVTAEDRRDRLLPAGNLRDGLRALGRADIVVLREHEAAGLLEAVRRVSNAEIWLVRREIVLSPDRPRRPVVFCGIARPEGFLAMLRQAGVEPAGAVFFPDHHPYRREDFERLLGAAQHAGADGFLTTAKDDVRISAEGRALLAEAGPVWVAALMVSLVDEAQARARLRRLTSPGSCEPPAMHAKMEL